MLRPIVDTSTALPPWKRALDLLCCLLALPFLAIATAVVAVIMSISSRGPIFFRQERVGYRGRRFYLYKLRTMHVCADPSMHEAHFRSLVSSRQPMWKMDAHDRRLIFGAKLLRALGIDELPQIVNVWRGEMSIVGPRPCIPYEYEQYSMVQRARFDAVPGLTGLWQVSGKNRTTFEQMVHLDTIYLSRRSLLVDLGIILRTVPAMIRQVWDTRGNYGRQGEVAADEVPIQSQSRFHHAAPPLSSFSAHEKAG